MIVRSATLPIWEVIECAHRGGSGSRSVNSTPSMDSGDEYSEVLLEPGSNERYISSLLGSAMLKGFRELGRHRPSTRTSGPGAWGSLFLATGHDVNGLLVNLFEEVRQIPGEEGFDDSRWSAVASHRLSANC